MGAKQASCCLPFRRKAISCPVTTPTGKGRRYRKDQPTGRLARINTWPRGPANTATDTVRVSADGNRIVTSPPRPTWWPATIGLATSVTPMAPWKRIALKQSCRLRISTTTTASCPTSRPTARFPTFRRSHADPASWSLLRPGLGLGGTGRSVVKGDEDATPDPGVRGFPQVYALNDGFAPVLRRDAGRNRSW